MNRTRIKKSWKVHIYLIGLTALTLVIFAVFVIVAEQLGFVQFYLGETIGSLSPMDSWLIVALIPFGFAFYLTYYLLYRLKFVKIA